MCREGVEAKPGFTQSVSVVNVKITGVFRYFDRVSGDAATVDPNIICDLGSVQVDVMFYIYRMFVQPRFLSQHTA
jgi:hypothetical protein